VQGHTDNAGDAKKNEKLSQSRAEAVVVYLIKQGVDVSRLAAKGYGAQQPAVPNTTKANREKNRRVEFHVLEVQSPGAPAVAPAKS
jgi:outer membrane protein OmpA-like peptidoglycan-associated protein